MKKILPILLIAIAIAISSCAMLAPFEPNVNGVPRAGAYVPFEDGYPTYVLSTEDANPLPFESGYPVQIKH